MKSRETDMITPAAFGRAVAQKENVHCLVVVVRHKRGCQPKASRYQARAASARSCWTMSIRAVALLPLFLAVKSDTCGALLTS